MSYSVNLSKLSQSASLHNFSVFLFFFFFLTFSRALQVNSIFPQDAGREDDRSKLSTFSLSTCGIFVERLSFKRLHLCSILLPIFFLNSFHLWKGVVTDFFYFNLRKKIMPCQSRPGGVKYCFWRIFVHITTSRAKLNNLEKHILHLGV